MLFAVVSPAKSLDFDTPPHVATHTRPRFLRDTAPLMQSLRGFSAAELGKLMELSPELSALNVARYKRFRASTAAKFSKQAVLAFDGDVYGGLDARSLSDDDLLWAQDHLGILSGLYGLLRPLDRIEPHRLEMGTSLTWAREAEVGKGLYAYWNQAVTQALHAALKPRGVLVNLASVEYFGVVKAAALQAKGHRIIECRFEELRGGVGKVISFNAKRARGLMARHLIVQRADEPEAIKDFAEEGYAFKSKLSSEQLLVFQRSS
jgi:uncharacterized protein